MRVAFTSCFDASADPVQSVWTSVASHSPDVLLLLGDSIYMDYWPRLGVPKAYSKERFAAEMHDRYRKQWAVPAFRSLIRSVKHIGLIWDDHDFAWNGSCGVSRKEKCLWNDETMRWDCVAMAENQPYVDVVPEDKKRIAHILFNQFKGVLRHGRDNDNYPPMPPLDAMLAQPVGGIQECFDLDGVRFIMLDGRTWREPILDSAHPGAMFGTEQQAWLLDKSHRWKGLKVIGSGSTLARSPESWDRYRELEWLMAQRLDNIVVLSGDIHHNALRKHEHDGYVLHEATASGAARPGVGGGSGNFGILETNGDIYEIRLYENEGW